MYAYPQKIALAAAVMAAAVGLTAAEAALAKVHVVQSSAMAIAPGSTYAWAPISTARVSPGAGDLANEITEARLRTAVDQALAAKGFRKVADRGSAQLMVSYHVALQTRTEARLSGFGGRTACGFRGCLSGSPTDYDVRESDYTQGSLILDLNDRHSGRLLWRAASDKRVDEKDVSQAKLNKVVAEMTKSLPAA